MRGKSRIVAIANQKGGVGKTTTAINLAASLADAGRSVTVIDLDPQGNASTGLGIPVESRTTSTFDVLTGEANAAQAEHETAVPGLTVVPATSDLSSAELDLAAASGRLTHLRTALRRSAPSGETIIIDCPPTLGLLTLNALVAADGLLVPLQSEFYALEGLSQLLLTLREVRRSANPALRLDGVVLTMADQRNRLAQQVEADARATLGDVVFQTVIPRNVRLSEAPSHGLPVMLYDPQSRGARAYRDLAEEYLNRISVEG
ncbi:AAA family ATPase [Paracoccus sp. S-4012]|uniref:ParA family protein n=1 Tax=Paracoccus sp. S-4012 TaxID=2665648 RepID=UPI0012AF8AC5|nr:ParA family protein [Paracoccus sp. S-4012]MRX49862.1 AAA family ATPase [Paracoccus sp. S-4012]